MPSKLTQSNFLARCKEVHGDKFTYENAIYKKASSKVIVNCRLHGQFSQVANAHLSGKGCSKCSGREQTTEEFIDKSKSRYGERFDYSETNYVNSKTKVSMRCKIHGSFSQKPTPHLNTKHGCPKCADLECSRLNINSNSEYYLNLAKEKHGEKYSYDEVEFERATGKVKINCNNCGNSFMQSMSVHAVSGQGCPSCKESKGEKEIARWLDERGMYYQKQWSTDLCRGPKGYPLKFDFKVGYHKIIEFDGVQHSRPVDFFGGEKAFQTLQKNDQAKNNFCKENSLSILRVDYREDIQEKLKSFLI